MIALSQASNDVIPLANNQITNNNPKIPAMTLRMPNIFLAVPAKTRIPVVPMVKDVIMIKMGIPITNPPVAIPSGSEGNTPLSPLELVNIAMSNPK